MMIARSIAGGVYLLWTVASVWQGLVGGNWKEAGRDIFLGLLVVVVFDRGLSIFQD